MEKTTYRVYSSVFRETKCKFKDKCSLYSTNSYTCIHTGGNYCGRYRKLNQDNKLEHKKGKALMEIAQ